MARMRRDQRKKAKKEAIAVSNVTSASGPSEFEASAVGTPVPEISEMKPVMIAMAVEDHESSPDPDKTSPAVDKKKARGKKGKLFADMDHMISCIASINDRQDASIQAKRERQQRRSNFQQVKDVKKRVKRSEKQSQLDQMKHRLVVEQNLKKKARTWVNKEKKRAQVVSGQTTNWQAVSEGKATKKSVRFETTVVSS